MREINIGRAIFVALFTAIIIGLISKSYLIAGLIAAASFIGGIIYGLILGERKN